MFIIQFNFLFRILTQSISKIFILSFIFLVFDFGRFNQSTPVFDFLFTNSIRILIVRMISHPIMQIFRFDFHKLLFIFYFLSIKLFHVFSLNQLNKSRLLIKRKKLNRNTWNFRKHREIVQTVYLLISIVQEITWNLLIWFDQINFIVIFHQNFFAWT